MLFILNLCSFISDICERSYSTQESFNVRNYRVISMTILLLSIMMLGLARKKVGRVARTNFIDVMFRVRY